MTSPLAAFNHQLTELIQNTLPSTVTIEGYSGDLSENSQGSGWIYAPDYVVTNHHVIKGLVAPITVRPVGRAALQGSVIGSDPINDVAVLHVPGLDGTPLKLEEASPRLGELCVAIGSPHSFRESASLGIISGLSRQVRTEDGVMEEMLQTDASVNPGNSGGPLINIQGCLLGMNTMGPAETVNLAVPAETIAHVVPELQEHGAIQRATIGISIAITTQESQGLLGQSIVIKKVKGSFGHELRAGDILVSIDGQSISRRIDVIRAFNRSTIGRTVPLVVKRDGKDCQLEVTPAAR